MEIKVMKGSDYMPPNMMLLSPNLYDLLTKTAEEQAKTQAGVIAELNRLKDVLTLVGGAE